MCFASRRGICWTAAAKRPAMAEADDRVLAALDFAAQEAGAGSAECAQRQAFLAEIGRDLAIVKPEASDRARPPASAHSTISPSIDTLMTPSATARAISRCAFTDGKPSRLATAACVRPPA